MTNAEMKPDRYGRWGRARAIIARIQAAFAAGKRVTIGTYTRATTYDARHAGMFRATRTGPLVQRGKRWEDFSYCAIIISD